MQPTVYPAQRSFATLLLKIVAMVALALTATAVFYYLVIFIPSRQQAELDLAYARYEQEVNNQALLTMCIIAAQQNWLEHDQAYQEYFAARLQQGDSKAVLQQVLTQAYATTDEQLRQEKDDCFRQFPQ